jgi:hypothetical protein
LVIETKSWVDELRREWKLTDQFPEMAIEAAFRYFFEQGAKSVLPSIVADPSMSPSGWRLEKK